MGWRYCRILLNVTGCLLMSSWKTTHRSPIPLHPESRFDQCEEYIQPTLPICWLVCRGNPQDPGIAIHLICKIEATLLQEFRLAPPPYVVALSFFNERTEVVFNTGTAVCAIQYGLPIRQSVYSHCLSQCTIRAKWQRNCTKWMWPHYPPHYWLFCHFQPTARNTTHFYLYPAPLSARASH